MQIMLKVCRFNPIPGGGGYIYLPLQLCDKIQTAIDISWNSSTFNFCGQLKHDISSLMYVSISEHLFSSPLHVGWLRYYTTTD